ncbi:5-oxoprolinase subunit PxpA [Winogradskyella vincentii]|uniref:5-oxoprolinase subunit PxpA n=1 Tax=Winogradskyella vincentii TaxID=2877122 RepID=A0ABS7Y0S3_9FLAO|nr:5-oxoprolinase subunit PxpA [Winogradskyella vincentii]MCA0152849.1 5-oxoprolinase subunit PxpA [Winogradskyella vincentii]
MTKTYSVDINADLGEGIGNEEMLMPFLSSCNIACGGHAGDKSIIQEVLKLAKQHNVKVGAHPSFPDRENFGRKIMDIEPKDLKVSLLQQIHELKKLADELGLELNHIKPHGALYNLITIDKETANIVVETIKDLDFEVKLYAPFNSVIAKLAIANNIEVVYEAFADRNYNEDLTLVSRKLNNAIKHKKEEVLSHVLGMVKDQKVITVNHQERMIKASTFCVHGDTENALEIVRYLNSELPKNGVEVE